MLKQVPSYQDSQGTLHASRLKGLLAERKIELRGIIQSGVNGIPLKNSHLTTEEAVLTIIEHSDSIKNIMGKYHRSIKAERTKENPVNNA